MPLSIRNTAPRFGGQQFNSFQAMGAYGGGAPSAAPLPIEEPAQAAQIDPALIELLMRQKAAAAAEQGAKQIGEGLQAAVMPQAQLEMTPAFQEQMQLAQRKNPGLGLAGLLERIGGFGGFGGM